MAYMTATDKLFGTTSLSQDRAETIRKTYLLLGLAVVGALCGGYLGAQSDALASLFTGWLGWILATLHPSAVLAGPTMKKWRSVCYGFIRWRLSFLLFPERSSVL